MTDAALAQEIRSRIADVDPRRNQVLWVGSTSPPELDRPVHVIGPDRLKDDEAGDNTYDAVILPDPPDGDAVGVLRAAQRALRPGGRLLQYTPRRDRRLQRILDAHFEGEAPPPGKPFQRVRARKSVTGGWLTIAHRRNGSANSGHFDALASDYGDEIPDHLADHYRQRKLHHILQHAGPGKLVLDLGCGIGDYAHQVARKSGARVIAVDASPASLRMLQRDPRQSEHPRGSETAPAHDDGPRAAPFGLAASALALPLASRCLDVVYTINMLHHLKQGEQGLALEEIRRILKPGGRLIVCEMNLRNPLFSLYMRHVFPRTRNIDRGDEEFLPDSTWDQVPGYRLDTIHHHTFTPDFLPRAFLAPARRLESILERSPLKRQAVHYVAILEKTDKEATP